MDEEIEVAESGGDAVGDTDGAPDEEEFEDEAPAVEVGIGLKDRPENQRGGPSGE